MDKVNNYSGVSLSVGIVLWIVAAACAFICRNSIWFSLQEPVDIMEALENPKEGKAVTVQVDAVLDWYEAYEQERDGRVVSTDYYCMLWLDNSTFISMKVDEGQKYIIDNIIPLTWAYIDGDRDSLPVKTEFSGVLRELSSKEKTFFKSYLRALDHGDSGLSGTAYYYTIDTKVSRQSGYITLGCIIFLFFLGLILLIVGMVKLKKEKRREEELSKNKFNVYNWQNNCR